LVFIHWSPALEDGSSQQQRPTTAAVLRARDVDKIASGESHGLSLESVLAKARSVPEHALARAAAAALGMQAAKNPKVSAEDHLEAQRNKFRALALAMLYNKDDPEAARKRVNEATDLELLKIVDERGIYAKVQSIAPRRACDALDSKGLARMLLLESPVLPATEDVHQVCSFVCYWCRRFCIEHSFALATPPTHPSTTKTPLPPPHTHRAATSTSKSTSSTRCSP
jgi:hypothetical protein